MIEYHQDLAPRPMEQFHDFRSHLHPWGIVVQYGGILKCENGGTWWYPKTIQNQTIYDQFSFEKHGFRDAQSFQEPPYVIHDLAESLAGHGHLFNVKI
jgi:hypothetical protein